MKRILVKTTVAAIIMNNRDGIESVLLTMRSVPPYKNFWCLPGGHIDPYETAEDAIVREVEEETGLDFKGTFQFYFDEIIPEKEIHATVLVFMGAGAGTLKMRDEVSAIQWFPVSEAQQMPLAFRHNDVLSFYLQTNLQ